MCAEQTFVWLSLYKHIISSINKTHYWFFLHRLIVRRNKYTEMCHSTGRISFYRLTISIYRTNQLQVKGISHFVCAQKCIYQPYTTTLIQCYTTTLKHCNTATLQHCYTKHCYSATLLHHYTDTVLQCYTTTLKHCNTAIVLHCYTTTLTQCYSATLQHCYTATQQHCNTITLQLCSTFTLAMHA